MIGYPPSRHLPQGYYQKQDPWSFCIQFDWNFLVACPNWSQVKRSDTKNEILLKVCILHDLCTILCPIEDFISAVGPDRTLHDREFDWISPLNQFIDFSSILFLLFLNFFWNKTLIPSSTWTALLISYQNVTDPTTCSVFSSTPWRKSSWLFLVLCIGFVLLVSVSEMTFG